LFALTYGLMQLFYGPVGDRFGKYRVVMLACMGCGVGSVLSALSANLEILVTARIATALAAAAIIPLTLAWVGDVVHYEQRQETLARVGIGTTLGMTGGQLFGGLLTDTFGWRWAFALMAFAFAVVSFLLLKQLKHLEPVSQHGHEPAGFFKQLQQVAHNAWARTLLSVALVEGAMIFGLLAVTASHLHHMHHISLTLAGGTTALYGLGGMAYMAVAKFAIRRFGEVGLAGEVRPAPRGQDRLKEAAKLGFKVAVVPKANAPKKNDKAFEGLTIHPVERIEEAMQVVRDLD
jgi:MFS family permease